MRGRLAAIGAALCVAAGCGAGSAPLPAAGPSPSVVAATAVAATLGPATSTATTTPSPDAGALTPSAPASACRLSQPESVAEPKAITTVRATVAGLTDQGELLVIQSVVAMGGGTLSLYDPHSSAVTKVVSRPAASRPGTATSQIDGPTGNARWIVWEESGFTLEHDDWTMWALDRRTGSVRRIASFDPGPDGAAAPGWTSTISLLGDVAAWSAPAMLGPNRAGERIYVADLVARTVRRLDLEARWPSLLSPTTLRAVVQVGTDAANGKVLAQPETVELESGTASTEDWLQPAHLLAMGGSGAGTVVERLASEATADQSYSTADVVTRDAAGTVRTFGLPAQFGDSFAGTGFLEWTDSLDAWILPAGVAEPQTLLTVAGDPTEAVGRTQILVNGPSILWRPVPVESGYDWTALRLAGMTCP